MIGCVISGAGRGERLGAGIPKALVTVGGVPLVRHAVGAVAADPRIGPVVVTAPADDLAAFTEALAGAGVTVVAGGATRAESVAAGVAALPAEAQLILIHDAARPFVPADVVGAVIDAVRGGADGAVPGLAVVDTIKQIDESNRIVGTPPRARLRAVQTPQGFRADVLRRALATADAAEATDDAQLVERAGGTVIVVPGHPDAIKVTTPADLVIAAGIWDRRSDAD